MKRWITTATTGTGADSDPRQPNLHGVTGMTGWIVAYDAGSQMIVKIVRDQTPLDNESAQAGVTTHGDETQNADGSYSIGLTLRAALMAQGKALGAPATWAPDGFDVNGG